MDKPKGIKIGNRIYDRKYDFDGGTYYVSKEGSWIDCWAAVMNDGSLQFLFNGKHQPSNKHYEFI